MARGHAPAVALLRRLREEGQALIAPTIVAAEYLAGSKAPEKDAATLLGAIQVLDYTFEDALAGARSAREAFARGAFPGWMDALVAGFAANRGGSAVVTRNPRHFPKTKTLTY